jgi:hypothetical protein
LFASPILTAPALLQERLNLKVIFSARSFRPVGYTLKLSDDTWLPDEVVNKLIYLIDCRAELLRNLIEFYLCHAECPKQVPQSGDIVHKPGSSSPAQRLSTRALIAFQALISSHEVLREYGHGEASLFVG